MSNSFNILQDKLIIKSKTENLSFVRDFISSLAQKCGLDSKDTQKIVLAVDEACTNIIKHAYNFSPDGDIAIHVKYLSDKFIVSIIDNGNRFEPELVPEPNLKLFQKEKKKGGLGMFLMKKLMDEVYYRNLSDKQNQVELVKYIYHAK